MALMLREEITEQQLIDAGFTIEFISLTTLNNLAGAPSNPLGIKNNAPYYIAGKS